MKDNEFDFRNLPSWGYFGWGAINGLLLGIFIKHGVDISEIGILSLMLDAFKPLFQSVNMSTAWSSWVIAILGFIGVFSLVLEIISICKKGLPQIIIAVFGFFSLLALIIGFDTIGIIFFLVGVFMAIGFSYE